MAGWSSQGLRQEAGKTSGGAPALSGEPAQHQSGSQEAHLMPALPRLRHCRACSATEAAAEQRAQGNQAMYRTNAPRCALP